MENDSDYKEIFYEEFKSHFKKACKKYKHSFEEDFGVLLKVIRVKKEQSPQIDQISSLGKEVTLPIYKIRMHINEARQKNGRVIFLVDHQHKTIVFIDVYIKNYQENHDKELIKRAYDWYTTNYLNNAFTF